MAAELKITGTIHEIYCLEVKSDKFKKQEFILALTDEYNGNTYTNYVKFQVSKDRPIDELKKYTKGDAVTLTFNFRGNMWTRPIDGVTICIDSKDVWKIEAAQQSYTPVNQGIPIHASNHTTNGGNGIATAPAFNPSPETIDDLPF